MSFLGRLLSALRPHTGPPEARGDALRLAEVEGVLEGLRPAVRADGGELWLLAVEPDGEVRLRLAGACRSCYAQDMTLRAMLEHRLREALPWVRRVRLD